MTNTLREKAWDSVAARQFALDRFFEDIAQRCQRNEIVTVSFTGFVNQTACSECPEGVPLDEARAHMSGMARETLIRAYGLYWRAVRGVGVQFTRKRALGMSWYKELKFKQVQRAGEIVACMAAAGAVGASVDEQKTLSKMASMGEQLTAIGEELLTRATKLLPAVEPPDVSDIDEEVDVDD